VDGHGFEAELLCPFLMGTVFHSLVMKVLIILKQIYFYSIGYKQQLLSYKLRKIFQSALIKLKRQIFFNNLSFVEPQLMA
jgi:hypothetical protein